MNITAGSTSLSGTVGPASFSYGSFSPGEKVDVLKINGAFANNSSLTATTGNITFGAFDYQYENLGWDANILSLTISPDRAYNPLTSGSYGAGAPLWMMLSNPTVRTVQTRQDGMFGGLPGGRENPSPTVNGAAPAQFTGDDGYRSRLWATPFANHTNIGSYNGYSSGKVNNSGFILGYDTALSESSFIGGAVSAAWPDYERGGLKADGDDVRLVLYGGNKLSQDWQLGYLVSYGWASLDQDRYIYGQSYSSSYNAHPLSIALKVTRPVAINENVTLKPFAGYEYLAVKTDGYNEGAGTYALNVDGHTDELSRVFIGLGYEQKLKKARLNASLFWLGQYGDRTASANAFFTADPGNAFTSVAAPLDKNSLGLSLGATWQFGRSSELGFSYTGFFGDRSDSQNFDLNFVYKF